MSVPAGWRWFEIDAPLDEWSVGRSTAQVIAAHEALLRVTEEPLTEMPGDPLPDAPNKLVRYVDYGDIRVVFLVTRPIVADGLRLIQIATRSPPR